MRLLSLRLNISILLLTTLLISGCVDERFYADDPGIGEASISAEVVFSTVLNPLGEKSRATTDASTLEPLPNPGPSVNGDAIKRIQSLCVFVYKDENGTPTFYKRILVSDPTTENVFDYNIINNGNTQLPDDKTGSDQAESTTPKATFTLKGIPFGKYYFYAVANMGSLSEYSDEDLSTPDKLKDIKLTWNSTNIAANDQMFGYFTTTDKKTSDGFNAPLITVKNIAMQIHAWVKRAASKVTVAIDGSGLYDGVEVHIKSIQVRDISTYCWLGKEHTASAHYLIDGQKDVLGELENHGDGPLVTKQQTYPTTISDAHTETANAYFFYENMQGTGQLKHQVWPDATDKTKPQFPHGNNPNDEGYKDHVIAGTYIEVVGYYNSNNATEGEGPIIYRFMLGKDTETDYNVERNHHYKLTLKLKGWANDADWHIVYDQKPEIIGRSPYYISYVYDETMGYPVKIVGGKLISLKAEIPNEGVNKTSWQPINVKAGENPSPYWTGQVNNPGPWNGFLSLRKTTRAVFGTVDANPEEPKLGGYGSQTPATYTFNYDYFYGTGNAATLTNGSRAEREYNVTPGIHKDANNGDYTIVNNGDGEWLATIPLYTRARVMVAQTGYTGNNPYVAYRRKAMVRMTAEVEREDGTRETVTKDIEIEQMRRVVNPKGIWRSAACTDPFHVIMMIKESESIEDDFKPLASDGPWLAVIQYGEKDGAWFDLEATPGVSQKNPDGSISGVGDPFDMENNPGCKIDFTFRPKGAAPAPRGGIIKIYYNNFTCVHRIFVRQGYDPVAFYGSDVKWHSTNLLSADEEVADPVLEGSYFRRHNLDLPIASSNNTHAMSPFDGKIHDGSSRDFAIVGQSSTYKWSNITTNKNRWANNGYFTLKNGDTEKRYRIASKEDFEKITTNSNTIYGYGVIFTDGTTETPTDVEDVYGYGLTPGNTANKGMRGVFICDSITGMNIFLPIGGSGYGRFKQKASEYKYNRLPAGNEGVIQYANRFEEMPLTGPSVRSYGVNYKPLFWDLYRRPGALYWLHEYNDKGTLINNWKKVPALDINYYTFDFALSDLENLGLQWESDPDSSGTDAVQIRLVEVPANP